MDALPTNRSWPPPCSHGTHQHKAITSRSRQLLMMGTWLPETCWATIRREIKNTKGDIQLVFLIHTELRCTVNRTSDNIHLKGYTKVNFYWISLHIFECLKPLQYHSANSINTVLETSGVPRGGWTPPPIPRNSEDPPKSCQTQPDCENF